MTYGKDVTWASIFIEILNSLPRRYEEMIPWVVFNIARDVGMEHFAHTYMYVHIHVYFFLERNICVMLELITEDKRCDIRRHARKLLAFP